MCMMVILQLLEEAMKQIYRKNGDTVLLMQLPVPWNAFWDEISS